MRIRPFPFIVFVLLLGFAAAATAGENVWTPLGPDSAGQILSLAADPSTPGTLYAGFASGAGVWKTTNSGGAWTRRDSGLPSSAGHVYALAVRPDDPDVVFAAGSARHVYRSTDGGLHWAESDAGIAASTVHSPSSIAFDPANPDTLYVSWNTNGGSLFKSVDGGATWERHDPVLNAPVRNISVSGTALYAAMGWRGVYRSTDGAATWTAVNSGLPDDGEGDRAILSAAADPADAAVVYAMSNVDGNVYRSADSGANWAVASSQQSWGLSSLYVQPGTGDVFALGVDSGGATPTYRSCLFRSTDDGATFTNLTAGYINARTLAFVAASPASFYVTLDDGPHATADGGATWTPAHAGLRTADAQDVEFVPSQPGTYWASFYTSIGRTTDNGATFALQRPSEQPPYGEDFAVHPTNPDVVLTDAYSTCYSREDSCASSSLIRSIDGGTTWTNVPNPLAPVDSGMKQVWDLLFDPNDASIVYALGIGEEPGVYKSVDGGATFAVAAGTGTLLYSTILVAAPTTPTTLYMGTGTSYGSAPGIWRSTDGAASWQQLTNGIPAGAQVRTAAVDPVDRARVYASVNDPAAPGVYASTDGGDSWSKLPGIGLPEGMHPVSLEIDPSDSDLLYAGVGGIGMLRSFDGGASWQPFTAGMGTLTVWKIAIDPADHNHVLAGARGGLYEITVTTRTLTATKNGNGSGRVTSSHGGLDCGLACSAEIAAFSTVTITAAPNPGSVFIGWTGGGCSGTGPCTVPMDDAKSVDADFQIDGPDVMVEIAAAPATQGQPFAVTATVTNIGTTNATGVVLTSNPPLGGAAISSVTTTVGSCGGTDPVVCTIGLLAPGGNAVVSFTVTPLAAGTYAVEASAATVGDVDTANNGAAQSVVCLVKRPAASAVNQWARLGPDGGDVFRFDVDPFDHYTVYAATLGGAFKSTDRGAHWTKVHPASTVAITPHPTIPGVVFHVDRLRQVRKSLDGGATWPVAGTGLTPLIHGYMQGGFAFWPADPDVMMFTRPDGFYRSADGGLTWTEIPKPAASFNQWSHVVAVPGGSPSFFVSTNYGVFRSTDAGQTWTPSSNGLPLNPSTGSLRINGLALLPGSPATLLATTWGKVYASVDGGDSWVERTSFLHVYTLTPAPDGVTVYGHGRDYSGAEATGNAAIFVSRDVGTTWSILRRGYAANWVTLDPADPTWLYAGLDEGAYVSGSSGAFWSPSTTGLHALDPDGIAFEPGNASTFYTHGNNAGIFKTTDGGATFSNVTANLLSPVNGTMAVDPNDPSIVWSAGELQEEGGDPAFFDAIVRSNDGGTSWNKVANPNGLDPNTEAGYYLQPWGLIALPTVPTTIFAAGPSEGVFKSVDGGENFLFSSNGLPTGIWTMDLVTTDGGTTLYVTEYQPAGGVYKSVDAAATWSSASSGLPAVRAHRLAADPSDPEVLYVTTNEGVYKTTDGGASWVAVNNGLPVDTTADPPSVRPRGIAIDPADPDVLYVGVTALGNGMVYTTRDAGAHWWLLNGNAGLDAIISWRIVADPADSDHLLMATRGGLYETLLDLRRLNVTVAGSGDGSVVSAPGGIDCGDACFFDFAVDGVVTLTPLAAAPGSAFTGWSGACAGTGACQVTMNAAKSVTATFSSQPVVTGVSPDAGPTGGGQPVNITGSSLSNAATVTFGGTAGTNLVVNTDTSISVTSPAHVAGTVDVRVISSEGLTGTLAGAYAFVAQPFVWTVTPSWGLTAGGTAVTITGSGFVSGATVTFGGASATDVAFVSGTSLTATTPAHLQGAVTVVVTNPDGQSGDLTNGFTYAEPATLAGVSPPTGPPSGGTAVTLTGTGFRTGAAVTFGGKPATNVVVASSTTITATTPPHVLGSVTVSVTNSDGQRADVPDGFTYVAPPSISSVAPALGPVGGGTSVTLTGTGFLAGAGVTFGGEAATGVVVVSATSITATTPPHAAGGVAVAVTNADGQSGQLPLGFTYVGSSGATLDAGDGSVCDGQTVTIPVNLVGTQAVYSLDFEATFDPAKLTLSNVETGALTSGFTVETNPTTGRVRIALISGTPTAGVSGEVAKLTFQGTAGMTSGATASVGIENVLVNDATAAGTSGTASCSTCRRGDVNSNGQITAYDASLILQIVVGTLAPNAAQTCAADFNANGSITAYDASLVLQCVVGTGPCS